MKDIDILWFIEHIARELDVAVLASLIINKKYGLTVKIEQISNLKKIEKLYNPKIILLPYCYVATDGYIERIISIWPKSVFINLAWEQIFYNANKIYKLPRDYFARNCVYHHAWSKTRKKILKKLDIPDKNIFLNGQPAYKLYDEPYKKLFISRKNLAERYQLDTNKTWIFFPENYSWYFYSKETIQKIIQDGQGVKTISTLKNYCKDSFTIALEWLNQIAKRYEDTVEIILRPRPSFSQEYFLWQVQKLKPSLSKNIRVIKDFSIREWILASDIVISSFSTSLIEAAIAKKTLYILEPNPMPNELIAEWYKYVEKIKSLNGLFSILPASLPVGMAGRNNYLKLRTWARSNFYVKDDPIQGLADILAKIPEKQLPELKNTKSLFRQAQKKAFSILSKLKKATTTTDAYFKLDDDKIFESELKDKMIRYKNFIDKYL